MITTVRATGAAWLALAAALALSHGARAAGGAYQVDTADISDVGSCKVESWASFASNQDFFAATNPSCVVDIGRPFELSTQFSRSRADGDWGTAAQPKIKTNLTPTAIGTWGLAAYGAASFDLITGENTAVQVVAPATFRFNDVLRLNLNAGWVWDRVADRHHAFYGAGFDLRTPDNIWTWTTELYGVAGVADTTGSVQPRFQSGLRYRPIDIFSVDVIYGRNLGGENANWITLATIIRFKPDGK
jgi:hypothetical protein